MKKLFCLVILFFLVGCSENLNSHDTVFTEGQISVVPDVEIGDRFFINEMFEIFMNHQRYLGQIIRYQGYFVTDIWDDEEVFSVVRVVPSCCSPSQNLGLEVLLNGHPRLPEHSWAEITGTLEMDERGFLMLRAIYLIEVSERV